MKDNNNDLKQDEKILKFYKAKFFLIGFIIGIIPYLTIVILYDNSKTLTDLVHFKEILIAIGIATAFINALILQSKIDKKYAKILQINKGVKLNS